MVPNGAKRADGSSQLICADCKSAWARRSNRKRMGWQDLWDKQRGLCAFCGQPLTDDNRTHLDHDHVTGRKRGLVHSQCNQMIAGIENAVRATGMTRISQYFEPDAIAIPPHAPHTTD